MPASTHTIKKDNTLLVLNHLRQFGMSTRREIQYKTGLSWGAVSKIVSDLIENQIIFEQPTEEKIAGPSPALLEFVPMQNLTIGLELNVAGFTVQLLDLRCQTVDFIVEPICSPEKNALIFQMLDLLEHMIRKHHLSPKSIVGIGIAIQGSLSADGSMSLYNCFFKDWRNVPLKKICEDRFSIPVHIMHDPVCIALSEQWQRKLSDETPIAIVRLSYGIGMSYIVHGQPVTGNNGIAGELGHMVVNRYGPKCTCGNNGCLECYCSIRGIAVRIVEEFERDAFDLPERLRHIDTHDVASMNNIIYWGAYQARHGNLALKTIFDDAAYYLGIGIANLSSLLDPKYIILTGDLLEFKDLFLSDAKMVAKEHARSTSGFEILLSENGKKQASAGAALYFINKLFSDQESKLFNN